MKVLKVLWGLLIDDGRLATVLILALVVAAVLARFGDKLPAALVVWIGLVAALAYSIEHQLQLRQKQSATK